MRFYQTNFNLICLQNIIKIDQISKYAYCSSNKAKKILGYKTTVAFEDYSDLVNYIKKKGPKKFLLIMT